MTFVDNYQPNAITCIVSKLFEIIMLEVSSALLYTISNLFVFIIPLILLCVFLMKNVEYHLSKSTPVYDCYIDASKVSIGLILHFSPEIINRNVSNITIIIIFIWNTADVYCIIL
jgi:hypothetical protein